MKCTTFSIALAFTILLQFVKVQTQDTLNYTKPLTIGSGQIRGVKGDKVDKYLGIPYGQADRFKRSWEYQAWCEVKDTISFGKKCIGLHPNTRKLLPDESEDCLNLNVYVPTTRCTKFPVVVWINGENFLEGSGQDQDGSRLAAEGNVIVVTFNYRLGIFGFIYIGKGAIKTRNMGMIDQITALRWVNRNIARFGGDVNRITLMGSSAGSISASLLSLSPVADKLFNDVILMSGFINPFFAASREENFMVKVVGSIYKAFVNNPECPRNATDEESETCIMKTTTSEKLLNIQQDIYKEHERWFFPDVVKGNNSIIHDDPELLLDEKKFRKRNILLGFNIQDGSLFTNLQSIFDSVTGPMQTDIIDVQRKVPRQQYSKALQKMWVISQKEFPLVSNYTAYFDKIADLYYNKTCDTENNLYDFIEMLTDVFFKYPAIKTANAFYEKKANVYFYQFEHHQRLPDSINEKYGWLVRSYYGSERPFVFGDVLREGSSDDDARVSKNVMKLWTNFARSGDPTIPTADIRWPGYSKENPVYLAISRKMKTNPSIMDNDVFQQLDSIFVEMKEVEEEARRKQQINIINPQQNKTENI